MRSYLAILLLGLWETAAWVGWAHPFFLPAPSRVVLAFGQLVMSGRVVADVQVSLMRILVSLPLATALGMTLGLTIGWFPWVRRMTEPLIELGRTLPPLALVPIAMLWLGLGTPPTIMVIVYVSFWPMFSNALLGVQELDRVQLQAARTLDIRGLSLVRKIILPGAMPKLLRGLRLSVSFAILAMVGTEMITTDSGIGAVFVRAQRDFETAQMFAMLLAVALVAALLDSLITALEQRWGRRLRGT